MISEFKNKTRVVFCDIDNSLYDIESAMFYRYPDYPINSKSYDLEGKFLAEFYNPKLYQLEFVNKEVLEFLRTKVKEGYQLLFYSHSCSAEIYLRKLWLVREFFGSVPLVPLTSDAELLNLMHVFENEGKNLEDVIYIDDKPERIELLQKYNINIVGVKHPYNEDLLKDTQMLTPNYLLEKSNFNCLVGEV